MHRVQTPTPPVLSSSSGQPSIAALQQEQKRLHAELSTVKDIVGAQEALNAKRHEDILNLLAALKAKLAPLLLETPPVPCFYLDCALFVSNLRRLLLPKHCFSALFVCT